MDLAWCTFGALVDTGFVLAPGDTEQGLLTGGPLRALADFAVVYQALVDLLRGFFDFAISGAVQWAFALIALTITAGFNAGTLSETFPLYTARNEFGDGAFE